MGLDTVLGNGPADMDDPQTDESARSPSQCHTREQILAGAILSILINPLLFAWLDRVLARAAAAAPAPEGEKAEPAREELPRVPRRVTAPT